MTTTYELFKKYAVEANSVIDFMNRYYKHERFRGRGEEYGQILIESNINDFNKLGFTCISNHDSITGQIVAYYKL